MQIVLETSTIANSGLWIAMSEAYLEIPFVISMQYNQNVAGAAGAYNLNSFMASLKNSTTSLIDSIQVDMQSINVVQQQPFTNFAVSYRIMSEWSTNDLKKFGLKSLVYPDSATSSILSTGGLSGDGVCANLLAPSVSGSALWSSPASGATGYELYNNGLLQRTYETGLNMNPSANAQTSSIAGVGYGALNSASLANQIAKSYYTTSGSGSGTVQQWVVMATIRLKDLSDFFKQLPLMKGVYFRFLINYNSCAGSFTIAGNNGAITTTSYTQLSGRSNPLMIASGALNNPFNLLAAQNVLTNVVVSVACGIGKTSSPVSTVSPPISNVRLYCPSYCLSPSRESQYITNWGQKRIVYQDLFNYNFTSIAAGGTFNAILTNGIINPKFLVVIPFYSAGISNTGIQVSTVAPYQSFFDSAPATTSPGCAITNFQVQVSGQNMFLNGSELYDFQQFYDEFSQDPMSLNGGGGIGMSSGLLGALEWETGYRYYVCNLGRRLPADDSIPKSVVVSGINNSSKICDYVCFIFFERSISINLIDGTVSA